jgi:hypothetical protein
VVSGLEAKEEVAFEAINRRGRNIHVGITITSIKHHDGIINGAILILDERK